MRDLRLGRGPATGGAFADGDLAENLAGAEFADDADMLHPETERRLDLGPDGQVLLVRRQAGCLDPVARANDRCRALGIPGPSVVGFGRVSCVVKQFSEGLKAGRWLTRREAF